MALTLDIMALVVLSTIFLGFQPLTAVMIVIMSLLDDIPIMTIAYDNTPVSAEADPLEDAAGCSASPARWGSFSIIQSFGLLLIGMEVLSDPARCGQALGLTDRGQLQTMMFLQLVAGGHLLLFVTRSERWFWTPPYPGAAAGRRDPRDAGGRGRDVRLRLAGAGDLLDGDRAGLGLQHRLDGRARRRCGSAPSGSTPTAPRRASAAPRSSPNRSSRRAAAR